MGASVSLRLSSSTQNGIEPQKADHLLMLVRQELKELAVDDSGQR